MATNIMDPPPTNNTTSPADRPTVATQTAVEPTDPVVCGLLCSHKSCVLHTVWGAKFTLPTRSTMHSSMFWFFLVVLLFRWAARVCHRLFHAVGLYAGHFDAVAEVVWSARFAGVISQVFRVEFFHRVLNCVFCHGLSFARYSRIASARTRFDLVDLSVP